MTVTPRLLAVAYSEYVGARSTAAFDANDASRYTDSSMTCRADRSRHGYRRRPSFTAGGPHSRPLLALAQPAFRAAHQARLLHGGRL
jgi:hypothetical protein